MVRMIELKRLEKLFSGKLTAYQIATATDINIDIINDLLDNTITMDVLDETSFRKLEDLEESLFTHPVDPVVDHDETSA